VRGSMTRRDHDGLPGAEFDVALPNFDRRR